EIGASPLARSRVHVEGEEGVPMSFADVLAPDPLDADAVAQCLLALLAHGLALARGERGEKIIERRIACVAPMELLIGALKKAARAKAFARRFIEEGDVHAREIVAPGKLGCGAGQ